MERRQLLIGASLAAIGLSSLSLIRNCRPKKSASMKQALSREQALGKYCGEAVTKALNGSGRIVIVELDDAKIPALRIRQKALRESLGNKIEIIETRKVAVEPGVLVLMLLETGVAVTEIQAARDAHPNADAVLCTAGAPIQNTKWSAGPDVMIAPWLGSEDQLKGLREAGLLRLSVIRESNPETLRSAARESDPMIRIQKSYRIEP